MVGGLCWGWRYDWPQKYVVMASRREIQISKLLGSPSMNSICIKADKSSHIDITLLVGIPSDHIHINYTIAIQHTSSSWQILSSALLSETKPSKILASNGVYFGYSDCSREEWCTKNLVTEISYENHNTKLSYKSQMQEVHEAKYSKNIIKQNPRDRYYD